MIFHVWHAKALKYGRAGLVSSKDVTCNLEHPKKSSRWWNKNNSKQWQTGGRNSDKDLQGERASALPLHYELHRVPTCSNTMERRRWNFVRGCNAQKHWQLRFAKQSCIQFPNNGSTCLATRIRCIDATTSLGPIGNHQCVQPPRCQTAKDEASVKQRSLQREIQAFVQGSGLLWYLMSSNTEVSLLTWSCEAPLEWWILTYSELGSKIMQHVPVAVAQQNLATGCTWAMLRFRNA